MTRSRKPPETPPEPIENNDEIDPHTGFRHVVIDLVPEDDDPPPRSDMARDWSVLIGIAGLVIIFIALMIYIAAS